MAAFGANGKLPISLPSFRSAPAAVVLSSTEMRPQTRSGYSGRRARQRQIKVWRPPARRFAKSPVMTTRRKDDETVPDRVLERQPRPDVKRCADRIQHTAGHDKNSGRFGQRSEQRRNEEQPPASRTRDRQRSTSAQNGEDIAVSSGRRQA